jgi:protein-tyrosine-phosphatase
MSARGGTPDGSMPNTMSSDAPQVLFLCVHNAGRSQIAAALARCIGDGRVRVRSAGSEPASEIHPNVRAAMAEMGIDLSRETPRLLGDADAHESDVIVTMGCGDACPVYPGKRYVDWEIEDPAGKSVADARRIRGVIRLRVEALLRELGARDQFD